MAAPSRTDGVKDLFDDAPLPEVPPTFTVVLSRGLGAATSVASDVAASLRCQYGQPPMLVVSGVRRVGLELIRKGHPPPVDEELPF